MATINGDDTNNILFDTAEDDSINGLGGEDIIFVTQGIDAVDGGAGSDTLVIKWEDVVVPVTTVAGPTQSQTGFSGTYSAGLTRSVAYTAIERFEIFSGIGADVIITSSGDDIISSGGGADIVDAGAGKDVVYGGDGVDNVLGGADNDLLNGDAGADTLEGGAGQDILIGGTGADTLRGGLGDDIFGIDDAGDVIAETGGEGDDRLSTSVSYTLALGVSVETLTTSDQAGTAAINLTGNELANSLFGNAGANVLDGGGGADLMRGYGGNDVYLVDSSGDLVIESAGEGDDTVMTSVQYTLAAGTSVETLTTTNQAGTTALNLTGNEIGNSIFGNEGANVLNGAGGVDLLRGYGGADIFRFDTAPAAGNADFIADFLSGTDRIALDNAVFTGLAEGNIGAEAFVLGTSAQDANDRIIYDQATGQIFFDSDGNGANAAVLFATLIGAPTLTASDFMVI